MQQTADIAVAFWLQTMRYRISEKIFLPAHRCRHSHYRRVAGGSFSVMRKVCVHGFPRRQMAPCYDFRNFATHVIRKWIAEGKNVSAMLPYLSTYMGHSSLSATAYYIHLVPEHLTETGLTAWGGMPEVPAYEE